MNISNIRIITVSGRIASGSTTLAHQLAKTLGWRHVEGGEIFWEAVRARLGLGEKDTNLRPDQEDTLFDAQLKQILKEDKNIVLETKLAGFNAQGIPGIYKILVICADKDGNDQAQIRIDRLVNREKVSIAKAKEEVLEREKNDLGKWRRLYAQNDLLWTYWQKSYYDIVVNTYEHDSKEALDMVLKEINSK